MPSLNQICVTYFQEKNTSDPKYYWSEKHVDRKLSRLFYSEKAIKKEPCKFKYCNYLY